MKARSINPTWHCGAERGVIIPYLVLALVPLCLVLGLVIDSANLYQTQLRLQRATDAAAVASVVAMDKAKRGGVSGVGTNDPAITDHTDATAIYSSVIAYTRDVARQIALDNAQALHLAISPAEISVAFHPPGSLNPDTVYVDTNFRRNLWFTPTLPGFIERLPVGAKAGATIGTPVIAAIVVDLSTSISEDPDELVALRAAATAFLNTLSDGDYLEINFFNRFHDGDGGANSNIAVPITKIDSTGITGLTKAQIESAINGIVGYDVGTGSNGQGGLYLARMQMKELRTNISSGLWNAARKVIVFASDGRLNAHSYPVPADDAPLPLVPNYSSATHNKRRESARAMGIQQADLARSDGLEIFSICSQGCHDDDYSIPTMQRIAADQSWDGSIEWQASPDTDGYYDQPLDASAVVSNHFFIVEDTDGESADEYATLWKEFSRIGALIKSGPRMVK